MGNVAVVVVHLRGVLLQMLLSCRKDWRAISPPTRSLLGWKHVDRDKEHRSGRLHGCSGRQRRRIAHSKARQRIQKSAVSS
jgi:hypothetical protein